MTVLQMGQTVGCAQKRIGHVFKNAHYIWEAFQAQGSIVRSGQIESAGTLRHSAGFQRFPDGNRRLAVLGDSVLKMAVVEEWYKGEENRGTADLPLNFPKY